MVAGWIEPAPYISKSSYMKKNKQENDLRPKIGICKKFHENRKNFNFGPGFEPATFGALQYNVLAPYRGDQFWPSAFEKFLIFPRRDI